MPPYGEHTRQQGYKRIAADETRASRSRRSRSRSRSRSPRRKIVAFKANKQEEDPLRKSLKADWSFLHEGVLFGRDEEIVVLQEAFKRRIDRAAGDQPELILVQGDFGTGKSALVKTALRDYVKRHNGYFALGKFDQYATTAHPCGPITNALNQLAMALEEKQKKDTYNPLPPSKRILDEVGLEYCQVLASMAPGLARFWGLHSNDKGAGSVQQLCQDRVKVALSKFFRAIKQPVVLVMDDLQFAGTRALSLLETLIETNTRIADDIACLTVVGVYQSNGAPQDHPCTIMLDRLEDEKNTNILRILVENLSISDTDALLSRVLRQRKELCLPLAEIVHEKSRRGNVDFVLRYLKELLESGVLVAERRASSGSYNKRYHDLNWMWEDDKWYELEVRQRLNVEDMASQQIQRLPGTFQGLLKKMACIGAEVDLEVLVVALRGGFSEKRGDGDNFGGYDHDRVKVMLALAIQEDLILEQLPDRPGRYAFRHDRVQQAAYNLIPEDERIKEHWQIGRALLDRLSPETLDQNLFLAVNQLIPGIELLADDIDKQGMPRLFTRAGKKANKLADFEAARTYLDVASQLLSSRHWQDQYRLSLELYCSRAEAECCAEDYEAMNATITEILGKCQSSPSDQMRANLIPLLKLDKKSYNSHEAMDLCFQLLGTLGEKFPTRTRLVFGVSEQLKVKWQLRSMSDEDICNLPLLDVYDAEKTATVSILWHLLRYSCFEASDYFPAVILRGVKLTLKYGVSELSCASLAAYGLVLCSLGDYDDGYRYAKLGMKLMKRFPRCRAQIMPKVCCYSYGMVYPWKLPVGPTTSSLRTAIDTALDTGDLETAMVASYTSLTNSFVAGERLPAYDRRISQCEKIMTVQGPWLSLTKLEKQHVDHLMGRSESPFPALSSIDGSKDAMNDWEYYQFSSSAIQMQLAYHFGDIDKALASANSARKVKGVVKASIYITILHVYDGLTALEAARRLKGNRRQRLVSSARRSLKQLKILAEVCPENIMHKLHLLNGELEAFNGKLNEAVASFKLAIDNAADRGIWQFLALAHERASMAYHRVGRTTEHSRKAKNHLNNAIEAYSEWGACSYVEHLMQRKSDILEVW
ncbi:Transcriptional regulator [Seminavis robusta]|uniref:Transcriptional regulator n=1 Tax=Seminavis robusta TaxID=568900 RepID=A0A9N8D8D4_9STRA|nr:Transcriptional regulator [Seminavis robusta]|eukprot:Sro14_g010460.1 Transcriptional regulator (1101) ;mRNA; f:53831-57211